MTLREEIQARAELPSPNLRRAWREAAGVSQARVGRELGVSRQCIAHWERGRRRPSDELPLRLSRSTAYIRAKLKQTWLWDDWPGRGGRDIGIDLVAEDHEGGLWAIQAKHYHPAYAIKKADIDSFLSASSRAEFTFRLVIATTDHIGTNARNTIGVQEKPVGMLLRSQLEMLEVAWPTSLARLRPALAGRSHDPSMHRERLVVRLVPGSPRAAWSSPRRR